MNRKLISRLVFVCVCLLLVALIIYSGLRILESTFFSKDDPNQLQTTSKTIVRNGIKYFPRNDITVLLLMGINQSGPVVPTPNNAGGAADMLALLVFDEADKSCTVLNLNRDMMVNMPALNEVGKEVGIYYGQLAYSHTYGDGMQSSCENVRKAVSNLLYGVSVDHYFSLNMDAIAILNDAVGGVKVNVVDDFSAVDPELPMGEVLLKGQQAVTFVQTRWHVGDQLNLSRMERHKEYMRSFASTLKPHLASQDFVLNTYGAVSDYIVTDCSADNISRLATDYRNYPIKQIVSIAGENVRNGDYFEFYADEEAMDALILELFYAPK